MAIDYTLVRGNSSQAKKFRLFMDLIQKFASIIFLCDSDKKRKDVNNICMKKYLFHAE